MQPAQTEKSTLLDHLPKILVFIGILVLLFIITSLSNSDKNKTTDYGISPTLLEGNQQLFISPPPVTTSNGFQANPNDKLQLPGK